MKLWFSWIILTRVVVLLIWSITGYSQSPANTFKQFKQQYRSGLQQMLQDSVPSRLSRFYAWKSAYRVTATLTLNPNPQTTWLTQTDGSTQEYSLIGFLSFKLKGESYTLNAFQDLRYVRNPYFRTLLFVPFTDQTNGQYTYDGGRYLQVRYNESSPTLWLDFNQSINPLCAYTNVTCPRVPLSNFIARPVKSGEKSPKIHKFSTPANRG